MRHIAFFLILITLVACAPVQEGAVTIMPTQASLEGNVNITHPISGSIIYTESLFLQGTASNIPAEGFRIQLIAPDDSILAETIVQSEGETWQVEIVHEYNGEPIETIIIARSLDNAVLEDYDIESIVISSSEYRPEGTFGAIITPTSNTTVGGDQIPIIGRGSGFFEGTFILALEEADDGAEISQLVVTMFNPYFLDDMIWEVDLPTNGFTGHAVLRMFYHDAATGATIDIERIELVVSSIAG